MPPCSGTADKVTGSPKQTGLADGVRVTLTGCFGSTVMIILPEVSGLFEAQGKLEERMQSTLSPFKGMQENRESLVPVLIPLTLHWKTGTVPPLEGTAWNNTVVPSQMLSNPAVIVTLTGSSGFTVSSITFDSAAPDQSGEQLTLAIRLNHVVWVVIPALYEAELLPAISVNPAVLLVVDTCHLY